MSDGLGYADRRRFTVLRHPRLGKVAVVDTFRSRLGLLRRRVVAWAEVCEAYSQEAPTRTVMVGLTLRRPDDYEAGLVRDYLKALKQKMGANLLAWAWVAEVQKRGAVHWHMVVVMPKGHRFPYPDKTGMWPHGSSSVTPAKAGAWYLVKYVGKEHQKDLSRYPKGCRLYGVSVRFPGQSAPGVSWLKMYRRLAGLAAGRVDRSEWKYVGSAVTEGYAKAVLGRSAEVYNSVGGENG